MTRFINALNKRLSLKKDSDKGFTLIELLVVVIIIGILAAIAIPVYLGIQNNAKNSSVQSDLTNAKIAIISIQTSTGVLPASAADISAGTPPTVTASDGFTQGSNTATIKYVKGTTSGFCLSSSVVGGDASKFYVTDTSGVVKLASTATLPSGC